MIVCLFTHTRQGEAALADLVDAGVAHESVQVVGDLGAAASQPGAEHHVTFDALHVPADLRTLFMDTVREGGVVLAVADAAIADDLVEEIARGHDALRVEKTRAAGHNASHNAAE